MPQKTMIIYTQGVKFTIEGSPKFVDGWVRFLMDAPEPLVESQDAQSFPSQMSDPHNGCPILPTKGGSGQ